LPVSSFTIARYVKFMPSFDIITSTGFIKTEYLLLARHFNARLIENTYGIRWKIGKCEHRSFSLVSWERCFAELLTSSAFVRHTTRVHACSKDFTAGPSYALARTLATSRNLIYKLAMWKMLLWNRKSLLSEFWKCFVFGVIYLQW
jgi:hypothetical protein